MMTMHNDSDTPISQPMKYSMDSTDTWITITQNRETKAMNRLRVATIRIINANKLAIAIPWKADVTMTFSVGIHAQLIPAVYYIDCIEEGARSLYFEIYSSHYSKMGCF